MYLSSLALHCLDAKSLQAQIAHPVGIDLGAATVVKFNEVSQRIGVDVFIGNGKLTDKPPVTTGEA